MHARPLNTKDNRHLLNATALNPADFPVGSLQSRAIARRLSAQMNDVPPADQDVLILFGGAVYLNAQMNPGGKDFETTSAYKRGQELWRKRYGATIPSDADSRSARATLASIEFERVFGREPEAGDVLTQAVVYASHSSEMIELEYRSFIDAWSRQIPELPCPLRLEATRLCRRMNTASSTGGEWEEAIDVYGEAHWRCVEYEIFRDLVHEHGVRGLQKAPHTPAVIFRGVIDGKHRCGTAS
jgi:hypothetical protein